MYIDEFVEDLSNCIGFISGDELILKKMRYDFEYEIRTRNRDKKLGAIKWDLDNHCIVILLNNKSYSFDRSELTIEKTKEIGKMINKAYYNMDLDEAKQILKENGYILEDTETQDDEYRVLHRQYDDAIKDGPAKSDPLLKKKLKLYYQHLDLEDKIEHAKKFNSQVSNEKFEAQDVVNAMYNKFDPDFGGLNGWSCNVDDNNTIHIEHKNITIQVKPLVRKQAVKVVAYADSKNSYPGKHWKCFDDTFVFDGSETLKDFFKGITYSIKFIGK